MKALSIQQPWAWAILHAGKDVENRRWPTAVRGRIVIHAGRKIDREGVEYLRYHGYPVPMNLPTGGFVGEVTISGCVHAEEKRGSHWACGPWCFVLEGPKPYERLIPAVGRLGFWEVTAEELAWCGE